MTGCRRWGYVATATVLLSACGGSGQGGSINVISASSAATTKAGTCKLQVRTSGGGVTETIDGEADFGRSLVHLSGSQMVNGKEVPSEEIMTSTAAYTRGFTGGALPGRDPSKPWIEFDMGASISQALSPLVGGNPTAILKGFGATASDAHRIGTEQVRGVATTHYTVRVALGGQSAVFGVWIDHEGLLRRLEGQNLGSPASSTSPPITTTLEFFDFGAPVSITLPPADQVWRFGPNMADFPQPTGAWLVAQRGHNDGVAWTLRVTSASKSGQCLAVDTTPASAHEDIQLAGNGEATSSQLADHSYLGHEADCAPAPIPADLDLLAPLLSGDLTQGGPGPHFIAGLATTGVRNLVAHLSDGTAVSAQIGAGTYIAWWTGTRAFKQLTFDYPGGSGLACDNGGDTAHPLDGISCRGGLASTAAP